MNEIDRHPMMPFDIYVYKYNLTPTKRLYGVLN
jgi:hypothetical protein